MFEHVPGYLSQARINGEGCLSERASETQKEFAPNNHIDKEKQSGNLRKIPRQERRTHKQGKKKCVQNLWERCCVKEKSCGNVG